MPHNFIIGELEQLTLLVILRCEAPPGAFEIRRSLKSQVGRSCARGALYRTLDRLKDKGLVRWDLEDGGPGRGGHPRRLFQVTAAGIGVLRQSRRTLELLWDGVEEMQ